MKQNIVIFSVLTGYFVVLAAIYTWWHIAHFGEIEWGGSFGILASGIMSAFIGFYLNLHYRKQGGELAEDIDTADIDDGDPELGEFSPWSWWPLALAAAITVFAIGLAIGFGYWLTFFAAPFILLAVVGLVFEYYRGYHAR